MRKSNTETFKDLIKSVTQKEAWVIGVPNELIPFIGCPKQALVLAEIIYLSDKGKRKDGFVYKTYDEMFELVGIKEDTLRSYFRKFREMGFFEWKVKKANAVPTVHFKFNFGEFSNQFREFLQKRNLKNSGNDSLKTRESLTKNTNKDLSLFNKSRTLPNQRNVKEIINQTGLADIDLTSSNNNVNYLQDLSNVCGEPAEISVQLPRNDCFWEKQP